MAPSSVHICRPTANHTMTAILLHGRGGSGSEFARDLFTSQLSNNGDTIQSRLPNWRWVFPSAPLRWSTAFQENMPAWFEAHSLTDTSARQDLQISGIRESVDSLSDLIDEESRRLENGLKGIVLGGISQGAAVGLWAMLCHKPGPLAGFIGVSGWLPFADQLENIPQPLIYEGSKEAIALQGTKADGLAQSILAHNNSRLLSSGENCPLVATPVFIGHGTDDAYVDVSLGQQARDVLRGIGMKVLWKEYSGAEEEGHWLKEPEELIDITDFLSTIEVSQDEDK